MQVMTDQMPMLRRDEMKRINREEAFGIIRMVAAIGLCLWAWSCAVHEQSKRPQCWAAHGQRVMKP